MGPGEILMILCPGTPPPLGFFLDLRSLNLAGCLAAAFLFAEAMLFLGCDVLAELSLEWRFPRITELVRRDAAQGP